MSGLDNFNWDGTQPVEFFGEYVEPQIDEAFAAPTQATPTETEEGKPSEKKTETIVEEEEEEEMTFFGESPETLDLGGEEETPATEETTTKTKKKATNVDNYYTGLFKDLQDKGIFQNVELEEGQELTAEDLLDLQEKEISERIAAWGKETLGETGAQFLKFLRDGGNPSQFLAMQQQAGQIPQGDIADENYQAYVVRYTLANDGWDAEEIEERVQMLQESGKLEKIAVKYNARLEDERKTLQEETLAKQKEAQEKAKQQYEEYRNSLADFAKQNNNVRGFKLTPSKAAKLVDRATKPVVKTEDGRVLTQFQDEMSKAIKDPEKMLLLNILLENDFDFSQIQKVAATQVTKQIKRNIENHATTSSRNPGSSYGAGESLAFLLD